MCACETHKTWSKTTPIPSTTPPSLPLSPLFPSPTHLEVVVVEQGARERLKVKVALGRTDKDTQLVAMAAGWHLVVGTQVAVSLEVFQPKEVAANGSDRRVQVSTDLVNDVLRERERECVCVWERERVCVCAWERERESVCVGERERESVCVCVGERECVCVGERERERVCVRERERESVCVREIESPCKRTCTSYLYTSY